MRVSVGTKPPVPMAKSFNERNQSDKARRKLKSLAKSSALDLDFVTALANLTWDYDPGIASDRIGWVDNDPLSDSAHKSLAWIAESFGLDSDFTLSREQAVADLIRLHREQSTEAVWAAFCRAVARKNYGPISEFASHYYLRGLDASRARSLGWAVDSLDMLAISRNLFLKLFRGGTIERADLGYLWCDLQLRLSYHHSNDGPSEDWISPTLSAIEALPTGSGLSDLIACCKGHIPGDKYFKQEVLQCLAYADVLRVTGLSVSDMFLPEHREELAPHFYSNEWSFPLRFWTTNGGSVHRSAIPATDES